MLQAETYLTSFKDETSWFASDEIMNFTQIFCASQIPLKITFLESRTKSFSVFENNIAYIQKMKVPFRSQKL